MTLSSLDKRIISALAGDLPEDFAPFEEIAARLGVSEEEVLSTLQRFRRSGLLRRFGATVNQRKVGFRANAMAVWRVPEERVEEAAKEIACSPAVSHCYERESRPMWPYNLYAMVHAKTRQQCEKLAADISRTIRTNDNRLLFSVREFKKVSPVYFSSRSPG